MNETANPGRVCPIDYRCTPQSLRQTPVETADTLYIIGGLYGNPFALQTIESLAAAENAQCVFNGDFNWFNCTPDDFNQINTAVLKHSATRGNVETEIARTPFAGGCGCGYPNDVPDSTVAWSNDIIESLHKASADNTTLLSKLRQLPTSKRYQIADCRIQVIHGDLRSLAGWSFSRSALMAATEETLQDLADTRADIVACTHTCEPYAVRLNTTIALLLITVPQVCLTLN